MKRMIRLLAGCLLSLCLLLPGVTALAAPDDTGAVSYTHLTLPTIRLV